MSHPRRTCAIAVVAAAAAALGLVIWIALPLPGSILSPQRVASITIEDRNGLLLRTTRTGQGSLQHWIALADIDPDVLEAFVAGEDHRFYDHHGVDMRAVARATVQNLRAT